MSDPHCSGCYVGFGGWWCDNCDQWPCVCVDDDDDRPEPSAAELLREVATDVEAHKRALARGYGLGPSDQVIDIRRPDDLHYQCPECDRIATMPHNWRDLIGQLGPHWDGNLRCLGGTTFTHYAHDPVVMVLLCTCDECWARFKTMPEFAEHIENSLDVHSMDLTGISGPSQEAIEAVAREDWAGIVHEHYQGIGEWYAKQKTIKEEGKDPDDH